MLAEIIHRLHTGEERTERVHRRRENDPQTLPEILGTTSVSSLCLILCMVENEQQPKPHQQPLPARRVRKASSPA